MSAGGGTGVEVVGKRDRAGVVGGVEWAQREKGGVNRGHGVEVKFKLSQVKVIEGDD